MNHDAKFQQIWEFRRRDYDGDSSDDSQSNPSLEPSDKKPKLDIVLLENDEVTDTLTFQKHDTSNGVETVEPAKKKRKPNKKENVVKNKSKICCSVKEEKKGKKSRKLDDTKEAGMFDDLKNFANSLINELKVARENMLAQMKEETRKFVASRPTKKKVIRSNRKKNKTPPQNGIQSNVKSQKCPDGMIEERIKSDKISEQDQVLEFKMTNKQPFEGERGKLLTKSPMHMTLPTVVPRPHSQSHRDSIHLNGCSPDKTDGPHIKPISSGTYYQGVPVLQSGQFQSFSHLSSKNSGFHDQNCSGTTSESVGFQVPINQELGSGLDDGSNLSSQTYSDIVFQDNSGVGMRMNARFNNGGTSRGILRNCISNDVQKNGGDFAPFRSQEMKGQFHPGLRNIQ